MPKRKKENPLPTGALVPQSHGGALRNGGTNKGGPGRPPSVLREKMRGALVDRIPIAAQIADDPKASQADRLRALDFLAKYGLGTRQEVMGEDGGVLRHGVVILPEADV
jgi:hypothetical protein